MKFGYNGEDFTELDLKTVTWIALKPMDVIFKEKVVGNEAEHVMFLTQTCPDILKKFVASTIGYLVKTGRVTFI